jgi:integrase
MEVDAIKDKSQLERMKSVLRGQSPRDYLMFVLGINAGLRIGDMLRLTVSDVSGQLVLDIRESKTGKARKISLNENALTAISDYLAAISPCSPDTCLFASRKGDNRPITRIQAWRILSAAAAKAGIPVDIGTHTMRKTFGYWAYMQGSDISLLQKLFNHSSEVVTLRYIGITSSCIAKVYKTVNL